MKKHNDLSRLFSMLLLLVLTVSVFMILLYEVNVYKNITSVNDVSDNDHIPYAYLVQRLRRAKTIGVNDDVLEIHEENSVTYIYLYEGYLRELTTLEGYQFDKTYGDKLFELNGFNVSNDDKTVKLEYTSVEGNTKNLTYSYRGGQYE
ncbi:MAG: DUF4860 domain-containing protein [Erysipelotrichaceae bacterium]|nr:DUF4860 domain-containing protein [Erysipelotrichaceae bacterium]